MNFTDAPQSRALAPGTRIGRYEILARLAAGGMATVYAARAHGNAGFERLVAVKVLHDNLAQEDEFIAMFLDEARLAARIRHPNVVATVDLSDVRDARYFLVMEYIEGDHLGQLLRVARQRGEQLPVPVVLRIVVDALAGLGAAHALRDEQGRWLQLVHRDVSPHNIMVGRDGIARLTDFGVAKAEDRLAQTREGQVKGKLAYMAPEQASTGCTDERSDLFSVGVLLWEALTGRYLFRADNSAAMLNRVLHAPIPAPSSQNPCLAPLDAALAQALARDPAQRFTSAEEFAGVLEQVAAASFGGLVSARALGHAVADLAKDKLRRERSIIAAVMRGGPLPQWVKTSSEVREQRPHGREPGSALGPRAAEGGGTTPGRPAARRRVKGLYSAVVESAAQELTVTRPYPRRVPAAAPGPRASPGCPAEPRAWGVARRQVDVRGAVPEPMPGRASAAAVHALSTPALRRRRGALVLDDHGTPWRIPTPSGLHCASLDGSVVVGADRPSLRARSRARRTAMGLTCFLALGSMGWWGSEHSQKPVRAGPVGVSVSMQASTAPELSELDEAMASSAPRPQGQVEPVPGPLVYVGGRRAAERLDSPAAVEPPEPDAARPSETVTAQLVQTVAVRPLQPVEDRRASARSSGGGRDAEQPSEQSSASAMARRRVQKKAQLRARASHGARIRARLSRRGPSPARRRGRRSPQGLRSVPGAPR